MTVQQPLTTQRQFLKKEKMEIKRPPLPPPPPPHPALHHIFPAPVKAPVPTLETESCADITPTVYVSSRFLAIKSSIEKFNEKKQKKTVSFKLDDEDNSSKSIGSRNKIRNTTTSDDNNNDEDDDYDDEQQNFIDQADISCAERAEKDTEISENIEKCRGENSSEKIAKNLIEFQVKKCLEFESESEPESASSASSLPLNLVLCSESVLKQFSIDFGDGSCKLFLILNNEYFNNFFKSENFHFLNSKLKKGEKKSSSLLPLPSSLNQQQQKQQEEQLQEQQDEKGEVKESFSSSSSSSPLIQTNTNTKALDNGSSINGVSKKDQQTQIVKVSDEDDEDDLSSSPGSLENAFKASNRLQRLEEHFKGFVHCSSRKFQPSVNKLNTTNYYPDSISSASGSSEFDTRYPAYDELVFNFECYDELLDDGLGDGHSDGDSVSESVSEDSEDDEEECDCGCEVCKTSKMRELNGQLRGLLKKPNRPPPARKNRVVFDETRNEFFEADYIILIREDCAYDEEDEEPCTCGEHELVRLCCEEGCQCNYTNNESSANNGAGSNDARAGQVSGFLLFM